EVARKFNFNDAEDMLSAIGFGGITAAQIATRLADKIRKDNEEAAPLQLTNEVRELKPSSVAQRRPRSTQGVRVKGVDNLLVRFARCCNPVPGDDIVGYITRGRGVSIHRNDCQNVLVTEESGEEANRVIEVEWTETIEANYSVDIEITGHDRR